MTSINSYVHEIDENIITLTIYYWKPEIKLDVEHSKKDEFVSIDIKCYKRQSNIPFKLLTCGEKILIHLIVFEYNDKTVILLKITLGQEECYCKSKCICGFKYIDSMYYNIDDVHHVFPQDIVSRAQHVVLPEKCPDFTIF